MNRVSLCLMVPFVLACGTGPSGLTIRLQGTVTAADDGSPISTVRIEVGDPATPGIIKPGHLARTDLEGRYELSFETAGCETYLLAARDESVRFESQSREGADGIRCTDEVQTFDFQLEIYVCANPPACNMPSRQGLQSRRDPNVPVYVYTEPFTLLGKHFLEPHHLCALLRSRLTAT